MSEKTLAIIKPDAVKKRIIGKIIQRIEDEGFQISGLKMLHLTKEEAQGFYIIHKEKPFYDSLTDFMSLAKPGTIRHSHGFSIERNSVHGSDAPQTAEWEIGYFYKSEGKQPL